MPVRIPLKRNILSPGWTHAITTIMGHPLSSESGKSIQECILYNAIEDPIEFWLYWDPTDPYDIKLLQEYVGSNGSVIYLPSSTIKSLISFWNYMNLLIKKGKSVDQKYNAQYFFQDDQWFNLTAHDMRRTLVNAGMKYHRPQIIPGTTLPNPTSPPSPAPMKSSIHLELTPYDSTSTTTSINKTCLLNTSCDHQLHLDHLITSPVLQDHSIVGSAEPEPILNSEDLLQLDTISVSPQATCNFETEPLPEFKEQLDDTNQEPTDTPSTIPTAFQVSCGHTLHPECTHNLMAIQCNQYPYPNHNSALVQFLAHPNCEELDPTDTPSAVPTALQAPSDDTYNPKCAHNPMETQCNHSTSQVKKSNHINPMAFPYPPDPGEHIVEQSTTPTALVERDKLDLSNLAPPKGEMKSSFSWTYLSKSPTSSTLCFGEPTLRKLTQVKLLCNPISSTLCDFILGKYNQETEFHITKHTPLVNRVSDCQSSLVTTPSSRLILDKPKIKVTKALIHHFGKNGEHFYGENFIYDSPKKLKLNFTTYGYMLMEMDWGGKFNYTSCGRPMANCQDHETHLTGHNTSEVDWGGHDPIPNHVHEFLLPEVDWGAHHPNVFLFLVNIDYDAKPNEHFIQGLWGEPQHRTPYIPLIGPQTDSLATGQSFLAMVIQLQWFVVLGRLVTHTQVTTLSKLMVASS